MSHGTRVYSSIEVHDRGRVHAGDVNINNVGTLGKIVVSLPACADPWSVLSGRRSEQSHTIEDDDQYADDAIALLPRTSQPLAAINLALIDSSPALPLSRYLGIPACLYDSYDERFDLIGSDPSMHLSTSFATALSRPSSLRSIELDCSARSLLHKICWAFLALDCSLSLSSEISSALTRFDRYVIYAHPLLSLRPSQSMLKDLHLYRNYVNAIWHVSNASITVATELYYILLHILREVSHTLECSLHAVSVCLYIRVDNDYAPCTRYLIATTSHRSTMSMSSAKQQTKIPPILKDMLIVLPRSTAEMKSNDTSTQPHCSRMQVRSHARSCKRNYSDGQAHAKCGRYHHKAERGSSAVRSSMNQDRVKPLVNLKPRRQGTTATHDRLKSQARHVIK